ncbi:MAG: hypothetical protein WD766_13915 [Gemmatimonadota bacterium]
MARYEREFSGMPAYFRGAQGMDPNYVEGYHGMRMQGGRGRAAYGAHRYQQREDLGTEGGYGGIHGRGGAERYPRLHPEWEESGGVRDPYRNRGMMQDFNSRSPSFARPPSRYDREIDERQRFLPERQWMPRGTYRPGYTNRGITDAGYSEGWAFGPMRGAR